MVHPLISENTAIYDGPDRTQRYSKAMKNHKKRASFDQACLPAQRTVIDAALKSCASVAQLAANEALTSTLFRDAFSYAYQGCPTCLTANYDQER